MTLRKRKDAVNWKRKQRFALCEELALKESIDLS
jgi:hypothetical protein